MGNISQRTITPNQEKIENPVLSLPFDLDHEIYIRQVTITSHRDFVYLKRNLLDGHIMIANLMPLILMTQKMRSPEYLDQYLEMIREYCIKNESQLSKIGPGLLLITPNKNFKIEEYGTPEDLSRSIKEPMQLSNSNCLFSGGSSSLSSSKIKSN